MMRTKNRQTQKNNIIILCEGSDTEYNYFNDLKQHVENNDPSRFCDIKIIPIQTAKQTKKNPKRASLTRTLKTNGASYRYWCKEEHSQAKCDLYKAQPTRYVREVQLFMEEDGYNEGWAVYDKDVHPDHANACKLAKKIPNLHVAFSSYSFEEWLLAHFERNPKAFNHSECKRSKYNVIKCGTGVIDDCHGNLCIAGWLREKGHIPDYGKSMKNVFTDYTLKHLKECFINSAWLRHLHLDNSEIYNRNPYTDVDRLVKRMLGLNDHYEWKELKTPISFLGTDLIVDVLNGKLSISNQNAKSCVINSDFNFCDGIGSVIGPITNGNVLLQEGESISLDIPSSARLLKLSSKSQIFIDIC
jgi:hypothetical protein